MPSENIRETLSALRAEGFMCNPIDCEHCKTAATLAEKTAFSHGFDAGNYGNAYESTDWEVWWEEHEVPYAHRAIPTYRDGVLLGFFSSYEISEISDEDIAIEVEHLRTLHPEHS